MILQKLVCVLCISVNFNLKILRKIEGALRSMDSKEKDLQRKEEEQKKFQDFCCIKTSS